MPRSREDQLYDAEAGSFDHTADVGIRVTGSTLSEVFEEAARATLRVAGCESNDEPLDAAAPRQWRAISVEGPDIGVLLVRWIQEVLFLLDTEDFVCDAFEIDLRGTKKLTARLGGRSVEGPRVRELKGVTYHGLRVEETEDGWRAQVVFDV